MNKSSQSQVVPVYDHIMLTEEGNEHVLKAPNRESYCLLHYNTINHPE